MSKIDDGGPAFSQNIFNHNGEMVDSWSWGYGGLSRRDYFAIRAPEPTTAAIQHVADAERLANPHGDYHKPPRHSAMQITCALRYAFADAMIKASKEEPR